MYKLKLKTYIFRYGVVTGVVGGSTLTEDHGNDYSSSATSTYLYLRATGHRSDSSSNAGGSYLYKSLSSKISMSGWKTLGATAESGDSSYSHFGLSTHVDGSKSSASDTFDVAKTGVGSHGNYTLSLSSYQSSYYVKFGAFCKKDVQATKYIYMYHMWLE